MVNFGVSSTLASLPYLASDPGVSRLNVLGAHLPGYRSFIPLRRGGGGFPQSGFVCLGALSPSRSPVAGVSFRFDGRGVCRRQFWDCVSSRQMTPFKIIGTESLIPL